VRARGPNNSCILTDEKRDVRKSHLEHLLEGRGSATPGAAGGSRETQDIPNAYRDRLTMPKFIINSAGDQYFLPDSSQFYFNAI
jgi:hypothetical protein